MQVDAGVRSAANSMTFGGADNLSAGLDSLLGYGGQGDLSQRYQTLLQREHARDNYDEVHRPVAHGLGDLAGTLLLAESGAKVGSYVASRLAPATKGALGEGLSWLKTRVIGDYPVGLQVRIPLSKGFTVADQTTAKGLTVESKFGPKAELSTKQKLAAEELAPGYRVDRWHPRHVGYITGAGTGAVGVKGLLAGDTNGHR